MKKQTILYCLICVGMILAGCWGAIREEKESKPSEPKEGMPIVLTKTEKAEVEEKMVDISAVYVDQYREWKGQNTEASFTSDQMHEMITIIAENGYSVVCGLSDDNMRNYELVSAAAVSGKAGKNAKTEFYSLTSDGSLVYFSIQFAKGDMTVTQANTQWSNVEKLQITYLDKVKVHAWDYTSKGWLIWEKEESINTEMDMHCLYRVQPLPTECRRYCTEYISPVSYMGNNLFLTDWDDSTLDKIVWNDVFEFLYPMKYRKPFVADDYRNGIPREEMFSVVESYFAVNHDLLESSSGYNKEDGKFYWSAMGSGTIVTQVQPFPEVVACEKKADGRIYLTVDAVSEEEGNDQLFSHCVILLENEDGSITYVGNQILHKKGERIPEYMLRNEQMR